MPRIDVHTAKLPSGKIEVRVDTRLLADLDEEEAGELAQQLLSKLGCSFEIKWPDLEPTLDERILQRKEALARRREKAEEYVSELNLERFEPLSDFERDRVIEAWIAGHDASPKPLNHPYR